MRIIKLTEAFSPSMPKWLKGKLEKDRLVTPYYRAGYSSTVDRDDNYSGKRNINGNGGGRDITPLMTDPSTKQRGAGYDSSGWNLWDWAMQSGLDINNAHFISGPIPENGRDPRLKEPNMPIWHLIGPAKWSGTTVEEVYFVGANDAAMSLIFDNQFKYTNPKQLKEYAVDFCYLDGSEQDTNFTTTIRQKQTDRLNWGKNVDPTLIRQGRESGLVGNRLRNGNEFKGNYRNGNEIFDKSGYVAPNLESGKLLPDSGILKKYAKELKKLSDKRLSNRVSKLANEVESLWREYPGIVPNIIANDPSYAVSGKIIKQISDKFEAIQSSWDIAEEYISDVTAAIQSNAATYRIDNKIENATKSIDRIEDLVKSLHDMLDEYIPEYADWDADEVEWTDY